MIYVLRKECMPAEFYRFTCQEENFLYLNGKNVLHPRTFDMVRPFIYQDKKIYDLVSLRRFKDILQCTYSIIYPDICCSTVRRRFDIKSSFQLLFKAYKDKERWSSLAKTPPIFLEKKMNNLNSNKNQSK